MSVFLIDYENVRTSAFGGLESLTADDSVIVFYTTNSDNLTFALMQRLVAAKARVEYKKVVCGGKNSLDFQLCSYLGYLIGTNSNQRFCIVSKDKGFSTMLSLWGENDENGNEVVCVPNISAGRNARPTSNSDAEAAEAVEAVDAAEPTEAAPAATEAAPPKETASEISEAAIAETSPEVVEPTAQADENTPAEEAPKPKRRRTYKRKPKPQLGEQTA